MKKSYPYIVGWKYDEEQVESAVSIYIDIICDVEKTKEFFNSDLKEYYRRYEDELKKDKATGVSALSDETDIVVLTEDELTANAIIYLLSK